MSVLCTLQAGYIEYSSHGDNFVGDVGFNSYVEVSRCKNRRWTITASVGTKKLCILQPSEWGGESEVRLLVIGIGRENCCHHWIRGFIHMCMKISMSPSSSSKMRGGIFIPIDITELLSQWKQYKPSPLLIVYNGMNHYDSTSFCESL